MFIRRIQLNNFKRFTDLTIDLSGLVNPPRLVLLIGTNGSGKSSIFDAFEWSSNLQKGDLDLITDYYNKNKYGEQAKVSIEFMNGPKMSKTFNKRDQNIKINSFYGRTSLRQVPKLTRTSLGQSKFDYNKDSDRPRLYIDRDLRFENDLEKITEQILKAVFTSDGQTSQIKESYINPINEAFARIFGLSPATALKLTVLNPPLEGKVAGILFRKGDSEIHYDLLSSGEKEIFNILINLLSRKDFFQDTIYFLDEIDLHLNTKLQYNLLKEITEYWIPKNCQLWTASHSLGFIEYANDSEHAAIIDLDDLNFDLPQTLYPEPKNKLDIFEVAIPKETLFKIFKGKKIFICENQNDEYYNLLSLEDIIFVGVKNSRDVFLTVKRDATYFGLRDRDFLTDNEILKLRKTFPKYYILTYYNFENYLYHPDNITEINPTGFDRQEYIESIINQKNQKFNYILPDIKLARNTYEELKKDNLKDDSIDTIINDLQSNELEVFYKFFDMKSKFDRKYLEKFNITRKSLVQTIWFKKQIQQILSN